MVFLKMKQAYDEYQNPRNINPYPYINISDLAYHEALQTFTTKLGRP